MKQPTINTYENAVFISYSWGGDSEEYVNKIDTSLQERGITIIRDKRDLGYRGSINEFMERIGQGNCVIVVICDKYLRSPSCMFELVELAEGKQFRDRIFPVVLSDANIYDPIKRIEYVKYWETKRDELAIAIRTLDPANLQGISNDMDLYDRIRDEISELTSTLKDMNALTPEMHNDRDFNILYTALEKRIRHSENQNRVISPREQANLRDKFSQYRTIFINSIEQDAKFQKMALYENYLENFYTLCGSIYSGFMPYGSLGEPEPILNLLKNTEYLCILLLSNPGGGKTATLKRFLWEVAKGNEDSLPIFIELGKWEKEGAWRAIQFEINRTNIFHVTDKAEILDFLKGKNYFLFFDGLNEIDPNNSNKLIPELIEVLRELHPKLAIISSRFLNEKLLMHVQPIIDKTVILNPLTEKEILKHLRNIEDRRLIELAKNPSLLSLINNFTPANASEKKIVNQSDIYYWFTNDFMGKEEAQGKPNTIPRHIKIKFLSNLAFELTKRHELNVEREKIENLIHEDFNLDISIIINSLVHNGYLVQELDSRGKEIVRFSLGLMVQEFFAAVRLAEIANEEFARSSLKSTWIFDKLKDAVSIKKLLKEIFEPFRHSELERLSKDPWWTETFILLSGILESKHYIKTEMKDWLIANLVINWKHPWLAYWCMEYGINDKTNISNLVLTNIVSTTTENLSDSDSNKRLLEVMRLLKFTSGEYMTMTYPRTLEYLVKAAGDVDYRVAKTAYEGLVFFNKNAEIMEQLEKSKNGSTINLSNFGRRRITAILKGELEEAVFPLAMVKVQPNNSDFFWISRYPITNRQYIDYLTEEKGGVNKNMTQSDSPAPDDHPVSGITFDDACDYCQWLTNQYGYPVRLPTIFEWSMAAGGMMERKYPWGNEEPDSNRCNFSSDRTTRVDMYPEGKSPYGCWDMLGNVSEWCLPDIGSMGLPVRGGSFRSKGPGLSSLTVNKVDINQTSDDIGFRIVISMKQIGKIENRGKQIKIVWV